MEANSVWNRVEINSCSRISSCSTAEASSTSTLLILRIETISAKFAKIKTGILRKVGLTRSGIKFQVAGPFAGSNDFPPGYPQIR